MMRAPARPSPMPWAVCAPAKPSLMPLVVVLGLLASFFCLCFQRDVEEFHFGEFLFSASVLFLPGTRRVLVFCSRRVVPREREAVRPLEFGDLRLVESLT